MVQRYVTEKRAEPRMMCADLVRVEWRDETGRRRRGFANLEDISASGACIHMPGGLPRDTPVSIVSPAQILRARTAWCRRRDMGYYMGLQFSPDTKWNRKHYAPRHLLDPRVLVARGIAQAGKGIVGL